MDIRSLTEEEIEALEDGLRLAAKLVEGQLPLSAGEVQSLYDALCRSEGENVEAEIAAGLAFGALIASKSDMEWVRVVDDYGEETALSPPGLQMVCNPISMLRKRIASNEEIDIAELCGGLIGMIEKGIATGEYGKRR